MNLDNMLFTSDTHFRHENILKYCPETRREPGDKEPYANAEVMDTFLHALFLDYLTADTDIVHLGDFAMGANKINYIADMLCQLEFRTFHLIKGNHDPKLSKLQGLETMFPNRFFVYDMKGHHTLNDLKEIDYIPEKLRNVRLCHFPYKGAEIDERQYAFLENDGVPLIHGHVHDAWRVKDNMINVGVDAWGMDFVHAPLLFSHRMFL